MKLAVVSSALLLSMACGGGASGSRASDATRGTRTSTVRSDSASDNDQGGVDVFDAATPTRNERSAERTDAGKSQGSARSAKMDAGTSGVRARDAGTHVSSSQHMGHDASSQQLDAGTKRADASSELDAGKRAEDTASEADAARTDDAGAAGADASAALNSGSCCNVSDQRGCGDPVLQDCVCARQPSCCTEAWTEACTRIVAERFCQSGVRDCVCGSSEGQWQQAQCCETSWDDTCESVATNKCGTMSDCK